MSDTQRTSSKAPRGLNLSESIRAVMGHLGAPASHRAGAEQIVHRFSLYGTATSLIPVPVVDLAAIVAVQATMLGKLAKHYGTTFHDQRARQIASSLIGSVVPVGLTGLTKDAALGLGSLVGAGSTALRFAPLIGIPVMAYFTFASTKTLGLLFVEHFEAGGTLFDFDPEAKRHRYKGQVEEAMADQQRGAAAAPGASA